jgi:hypothetical protein
MAERSYWKESVVKRRMITDTAWAKIYLYATEGCIRYCHGRRGNIQRESWQIQLLHILICAHFRPYNERLITGQGSD